MEFSDSWNDEIDIPIPKLKLELTLSTHSVKYEYHTILSTLLYDMLVDVKLDMNNVENERVLYEPKILCKIYFRVNLDYVVRLEIVLL